MKIIWTILSLYCFMGTYCYSQDQIISNIEDIPQLARERYGKIILQDKDIRDSLKINFWVIVDFKHPLKDTTKYMIVNSVKIQKLKVRSSSDNKEILDYLEGDRIKNSYQKYIWNLCNEKFNYWYRNQDYETMDNREELGEKKVGFVGNLYIEPL